MIWMQPAFMFLLGAGLGFRAGAMLKGGWLWAAIAAGVVVLTVAVALLNGAPPWAAWPQALFCTVGAGFAAFLRAQPRSRLMEDLSRHE